MTLLVSWGMIGGLLCGCAGGNGEPNTKQGPDVLAVTFNTGTSSGLISDDGDNAGYHLAQAELSDTYYGNGLAWSAVVDDTQRFLTDLQPDIIGFQELFYSGNCADIPGPARQGFVCENWQPGDSTVAQTVLGPGYQVACHQGKPDKCIGIKRSFGTISGCDDDLCLDGLDGAVVEGCGGGSRVGRAHIDLVDGGTFTAVNVHGSSGFAPQDTACRAKQFALVFEDLGDGAPAADGERNLVFGDWNTDPVRLRGGDESADKILQHVGGDNAMQFITDVDDDAAPTYSGVLSIDHVLSDFLVGDCTHPGLGDLPGVTATRFFDHKPAVCALHTP